MADTINLTIPGFHSDRLLPEVGTWFADPNLIIYLPNSTRPSFLFVAFFRLPCVFSHPDRTFAANTTRLSTCIEFGTHSGQRARIRNADQPARINTA